MKFKHCAKEHKRSVQNNLEKNQGSMLIKTKISNVKHMVNHMKKQKRFQNKGSNA